VREALEEEACDAWTRGMRANHDVTQRGCDWRAPMMVYADALQSAGDIRGDLIALDLSDAPAAKQLRALDRETLHRQWLGALASHPNVAIRFGLVALTIYDNSDALLRSLVYGPDARYIDSVNVSGTRRFIARWTEELAQRHLPWLGHLSLTATDAPTRSFAICRSLADTLAFAAPRLHALALDGDRLVADIAHPLLTSLEIDGFAALGAWEDGAVLPNVVALDLAPPPITRPRPRSRSSSRARSSHDFAISSSRATRRRCERRSWPRSSRHRPSCRRCITSGCRRSSIPSTHAWCSKPSIECRC
jgi:hypothetical protein